MYWNEKLDLIKRRFPDEFKDPFRSGPEITLAHLTIDRIYSSIAKELQYKEKVPLKTPSLYETK